MIAAFKKYQKNGFACLPTKPDKSPALSEGWKDGFGEEVFTNATTIALICGKKSGGLECMDFDNHLGDAEQNLKEYLAVPEVNEIVTRYKLPIEKTINGGYHLLIRCDYNEGNRKLALQLPFPNLPVSQENKPDCLIETRGEGGYFVATPTKGYKLYLNHTTKVEKITVAERKLLFDYAISMNRYCPPEQMIGTKSDRPGDVYNSQPESIDEMKDILLDDGWVHAGQKWRRPGKDDGVSATLGVVAPNVFYVFSSNAYPFEPNRAYLPFQVLALLKHNGDFSEAAKYLSKGSVNPKPEPQKNVSELERLLSESFIDTRKPITPPPTILSIVDSEMSWSANKRLFTLGNFSTIIGKAKGKKTLLLTMFTSAILINGTSFGKFHSGLNQTDKELLLWFDTEQGEYDSYTTIRRVKKMTGDSNNLLAFNLRPFSPDERCKLIEYAFEKYGKRTAFCVIDGIADLARGINDEEEATRVSTMLLRITKVYNCHVSIVIHQNKNDNFATGHLGSALMKKSEIIISVNKCPQNKLYSDVNCDMSRGPDFDPFVITFNKDGLPEITEPIKANKKLLYETEVVDNYPIENDEVPF
jgi:hypothetical protein